MGKINILPKHLAELIAAGEVVERPSSVVKELLENSIDAGADKIIVEIKNGGIRYIRITDNGCGIERDDIRAAFISHATSKIKTAEDLNSIFTLGFRGEALASVAAVAHVEVLTKTPREENGTRYVISGGAEEDLDDAGCPDGTTIIIRDLFYNTPARMKFLKKDSTEGNYVADTVYKIALSHPEISITLIKDNKRVFFVPGDNRLMTVINEVYGKEFAGSLIECKGETQGVSVEGYISKPVFARSNRAMQHCFVNGRYVKLPVAASALDNAYKNRIMTGKYPSCVLFLKVNPMTVDVNVHPAKTQVRFSNEKVIYDGIYFAALSALQEKDAPLKARLQEKKDLSSLFAPKSSVNQINMGEASLKEEKHSGKISLAAEFEEEEKKEPPFIGDMYKGIKKEYYPKNTYINENHQEPFFKKEEKRQESNIQTLREPEKIEFNKTSEEEVLLKEDKKEEPKVLAEKAKEKTPDTYSEPKEESLSNTEPFSVIGEAFKTYIIVQTEKKLLFIDKHAAHERIIFNGLKNRERKIYSQILMSPVTVTLSPKEYTAVIENLELFNKSGYVVEDFGQGAVRVRECPTELSDGDIGEIIEEIADKLSKNSKEPEPSKLTWLYHSTACRAAVKEGDDISLTEMESLVKKVLSDNDVRYCPHGRPVMFEMSEYEIKKLFGRNG